MNRVLSLVLIFILLLSCAGCVGQAIPALPDEEDISSQSPSSEQDSAAEPPPDSGPPEEELPAPVEEPEEPYVRVIDPAAPMVALTFDDGPHETYSDMILDILEENHAVATFFEVGRNVLNYPEPVARMKALGCEVGSHSYRHGDLSKMKKSAVLQDLQTADEAFAAAMGSAPTLLRPPYGAVNKTVKYGTGRSVITWTVDTEDWLSRDTDTVVQYVQSLSSLDGEIVLMHSTYDSTVEAVRILIPWLIEQGYQLVTVSELMAYYYGELPAPDQFYGYTYFTTHGRTDTPLQLPDEPPEIEVPEQSPEQAAPSQPAASPAPSTPAPSVQAPTETGTPPASDTPPASEAPAAPPEDAGLPGESDPEESELPGQEPVLPPEGETEPPGMEPGALAPEEGYYCNDYDEILKIKKEDDGTYHIEYSITHLLYVENAVGMYDSETGILTFSGKDASGNEIKAEIKNKGAYLEVTVTQSSYKDVVGTTQNFFQADADQ